ncbi:MAG: serine hydrolase domain-containing protein [Candidatus Hydrogenedentota bacterium]
MKITRRTFIAMSSALVAAGVHQTGSSEPPTNADHDSLIKKLMAEYEVPGLALAILTNGQLTYRQAHGLANTETDTPVTDAPVFEAASLTKPLMAQVAMRLVQDGALKLDRPLAKYLKSDHDVADPKRFRQIAAQHVLSHSTGLPNWHSSRRPVRQRFQPGTEYAYSGMAFVILQRVVEKIVDTPLQEYMQENLFDPLGMESASLVWRDDYETRLAHGHLNTGASGRGKMSEANAASSLVCNAVDYAKVVENLLEQDAGTPLGLASKTMDTMLTPQITAAENIAWGLGWGIQQSSSSDTYWHWGNNGGRYMSFVV